MASVQAGGADCRGRGGFALTRRAGAGRGAAGRGHRRADSKQEGWTWARPSTRGPRARPAAALPDCVPCPLSADTQRLMCRPWGPPEPPPPNPLESSADSGVFLLKKFNFFVQGEKHVISGFCWVLVGQADVQPQGRQRARGRSAPSSAAPGRACAGNALWLVRCPVAPLPPPSLPWGQSLSPAASPCCSPGTSVSATDLPGAWPECSVALGSERASRRAARGLRGFVPCALPVP